MMRVARLARMFSSLPALGHPMSLRLKLTALSVGLFVMFIWFLVLVSATILESHLQRLLAEQQLAATAQLARQLEHSLQDDIAGLTLAASGLPRELSYASLQPLLTQRPLMHVEFTGGLLVVGLDGKAIADYPAEGRQGTDYAARDWFRAVLASGRPYVGKPAFEQTLGRTLLSLAVPVFDVAAGRVRAVLVGSIDLSAPNFLGFVTDPTQTGNSEYYVYSPRDQLFIAASDGRRALTAGPERGRNKLFDRMLDGFEGSEVAQSSAGIRKLYSVKRAPTANWLVIAALPTEIAFEPIATMQKYIAAAAVLLTLLAVLVIAFTVRRVLAPLAEAARSIGQMTERQQDLAPLRVQRIDEVGVLLRNFNALVADRLKHEAALADSEQRFRRLVEGAPDAIFVQTGGCFRYLNGAALTLFGATSRDQLLGQTILERIHPDCRALIAERMRRVNEQRQSNPALEQTYLRLDGTPVVVEASAVPFRHADTDGALVFVRDISDKHRIALELDQHRNHLEALVEVRAAEVAEARDAAEAANRAKSAFLASMSHEIRTPLNAVVGLTRLLGDSPLDRRQRDYADKIELSAQALRALVDDILDFSRIEAGALRLETAPFSLNAVLGTVGAVVSVSLCGKPIEALFDVAPDVPDALLGDALRLQQILLNLTGNAVKFTESGDVVVALRCLARDAGQVTLQFSVRDTGIGIPAEQLGEIFAMFTQADTSISREYGGSGLGLAISARLAELMGGRITVASVPGQGSEFCFSVTLALAEQAPAALPTSSLSGLKILIVDAHPLSRDILTRTCASFGWVASAFDGSPAGLAELRRSTAAGCDYDLMLLNWRLPGVDGIEMLRQAHAAADIRLPLVVLMASTFEIEQAIAASDDLHLDGIAAKPLIPSSLFDAVARAYAGESRGILPSSGKTHRRLAGLRLLVAEDNELNQLVIEQLLTRAGAEVVIVDNGRAAVQALRSPAAHFDAVLMDIQMPVMDGYAATRVIREELGRVDLPIIAVTAHARPEDFEQSRLAGMVGHLVKPFDIDDLLDLLVKPGWCAPRQAVALPTPAALATAAAGDRPGFDFASALQDFGGDAENYGQFLRRLLALHAGDVDAVRQLIDAGDAQGGARLLHQLRGGAGFLRATALARLTAAAENALRDGDTEALPCLLDELQIAMDALAASIEQFDAPRADA